MAELEKKTSHPQFTLPYAIFDDKRLTPSDITILSFLYSNLDNNQITSSVSYSQIVKGTSISRPTVSKSLKNLENTGWINIERPQEGKNKVNRYILKIPGEIKSYEK